MKKLKVSFVIAITISLLFSTNIYAYPSDYSRTVPPITQQYSTWCWVADGLMAERYFSDSSVTQ